MQPASSTAKARSQFIGAMVMFGTIGIFVRHIPLSSSVIAVSRGIIGTLFLLLLTRLRKKKLDFAAIRRNIVLLLISGACIGVNWILLFESYRYTTVATATLCYYMAPIFVILAAPLLVHEKLTVKKLLCVAAAMVGMVLVSGVLETGISSLSEIKGICCGVGAAAFYASVILMNKKFKDISAYDRTILQLAQASVVLLPYTLLTESVALGDLTPTAILMLLFVGVFHTGLTYVLYFGSMQDLSAQNIALFSYIDPIVAIILSALLLQEPFTLFSLIGAVLILGAALVSDLT